MAITDPNDIAGLLCWFDMEHIVENPSGLVETIINRSTDAGKYANMASPTETTRPTLVAGTPDRADYDGSDNLSFTGTTVGSDANSTIFISLKLPAGAADGAIELLWFGRRGTTSGGPYIAVYQLSASPDKLFIGKYSPASAFVSLDEPTADWSWGDDITISITTNNSSGISVVKVNEVQVASVSNIGKIDGVTFAAISSGALHSPVGIYSCIMYDSVLTGDDFTDVESYVNENYVALGANAGADQSVVANETELGTVLLDGGDSNGPVDTYQWHEGVVELSTPSTDPFLLLENVTVGAHTYTLTVTALDLSTDTDDVIKTVTAFVPPTPPTIRTFKTITTSTATVHDFSSVFPLTDPLVAPLFTQHHNQLRVFIRDVADVVTELFPVGRPDDDGDTDFTINSAGTGIVLDTALVTTDTLLMMRDTQMNRAFVTLTNVARFRGRDRNVRGDQVLFIAQELREIRLIADVLGSDSGETFEFDPTPIDRSKYSRRFTGDGAETDFSYSDIEMLPLEAVRHLPQLQVFLDDVLQSSGFTIAESTLLVTFSSAPDAGELIELRRATRIDARWVEFSDGTTFSSLQDEWDFLNIKFIVQETQDFPTWILDNALQNRIFPRPLNALRYSGPGIRFFFGNLAWFGDGAVFIFRNDLLLIEGIDYTIDWNFFWINLTSDLGTGILDIITTTPNHAFGGLGFSIPDGTKDVPPDIVELPEVFRGTEDNFLTVVNHVDGNFLTFNWSGNLGTVDAWQFDVSGLDPADSSEIRLALKVSAKVSTLGADVAIRRCLRTWDIETMTDLLFATGESWAVPFGRGVDSDFDSASEITWLTAPPYPLVESWWISPDISALVTAARAGDGILRLLLDSEHTRLLHAVYSSNYTLAANHPQLVAYL